MVKRRTDNTSNKLARRAPTAESRIAGAGLGLGAGGLVAAAVLTGHFWILLPAVLFALACAAVFALPLADAFVLLPGGGEGQPSIGLGATVQSGATVEPGARIEMGATVESGATIRQGALVGMGSTIQRNATVESDAVIGWGATIQSGATIRRGAKVGAGATVQANAVVPEGARIGAGGTVAAGLLMSASHDRAEPDRDPRDVQIDVLCDRIEGELERITTNVEEIVRQPRETVDAVRRTCHDLLQRERTLRRLVDPAEQERLAREAAAIDARISAEPDEITRRKLQGARDALEDHRRQRDLVARDANRLEAEQTRLLWTMEGLLAHVIRLRSAEAGSGDAELARGLTQLREEVAAIADAIDHVQTQDLLPMAEIAPGFEAEAGERTSPRTPVRS